MANVLKKVRRGDISLDDARVDIGKEVADFIIYSDILASRLGINLDEAIIQKFDEVSDRIGCPLVKLGPMEPWDKVLADLTPEEAERSKRKFSIGSFVRYNHPHGSHGQVEAARPELGMWYVRYYYGLDIKGDYMRSLSGLSPKRDFVMISKEEFVKKARKK